MYMKIVKKYWTFFSELKKSSTRQTTNSEAIKLWSIIADILSGGSCVSNKA